MNFTTPQGEIFFFQGADIPAKYDLVNWQNNPTGELKLVLVGRVDGFDIHLNESEIQWSTQTRQVFNRGTVWRKNYKFGQQPKISTD